MPKDLSTLIDKITDLDKNTQENTKQMVKVETEIALTRKIDIENRKFLEKLVLHYIQAEKKQQANLWRTLGTILEWVLRVGLIGLGIAFGIKYLSGVI